MLPHAFSNDIVKIAVTFKTIAASSTKLYHLCSLFFAIFAKTQNTLL
jgi:hypothetical protein